MLLEVDGLSVTYGERPPALKDAGFQLDSGEILAVVGESGSGKSTLLHAIIGLLPESGRISGGSIQFADNELTELTPLMWQKIRGYRIGYIFQDAGASLNPIRKIGSQFTEFIRSHRKVSHQAAKLMELEIMKKLNLNDGERILDSYHSQLSGGMKQRVSIAMAMVFRPQLILADEPTSSLDTVSQAQIINELLYLKKTFGTAIILVTHNISVAAHIADKISIMQEGIMLEYGAAQEIIEKPRTGYTRNLLKNIIRLDEEPVIKPIDTNNIIFSIENVTKEYKSAEGKGKINALNQLSLKINQEELLGIAGESGCGKSTLAKIILGIEKPDNGRVIFRGTDIADMSSSQKKEYIRKVQMVFQEPAATFSPRMKIGTVLKEPLCNLHIKSRKEQPEAVKEALRSMLLPEDYYNRYPHELSGGELQRVSIARCVEIQAELVIYDEPTSALDSIIQKQILEDIVKAHKVRKLTSVFISHDIALLKHICDRIAVMYHGSIVEILSGNTLLSEARHPYTIELLNAVYILDKKKRTKDAVFSDDIGFETIKTGCVYYNQCFRRKELCRQSVPKLEELGNGNMCACFFIS